MNKMKLKLHLAVAALVIGILSGRSIGCYAQTAPAGTVGSAKTKSASVTYVVAPRAGFDVDVFAKEASEPSDFAGVEKLCGETKQQLVFAMNGAKCDKNLKPVGLFIKGLMKHKNFVSPDNNVFGGIGPGAVFAIDRSDVVRIIQAKNFRSDNDLATYRLAIQSGTILLSGGYLNRNITRVTEKQMCNGIGLKANGDIVVAITDDKMSLREFALFFEELNCRDAMLLDVGASCQWYAPGKPKKPGKMGQVIVVTKK